MSVRGGHLALDVPGQTVYELNDPDESGRWTFALSTALAVSFEFSEDGTAVSLILHQEGLALEFLREGYVPQVEVAASEAERHLGSYRDPDTGQTVEILHQNGRLGVRLDSAMVFELRKSADGEIWIARATDHLTVRFETDSKGQAIGLTLARGPQITSYVRDLPMTEAVQPSEADAPARTWNRWWLALIGLIAIVAVVLRILP